MIRVVVWYLRMYLRALNRRPMIEPQSFSRANSSQKASKPSQRRSGAKLGLCAKDKRHSEVPFLAILRVGSYVALWTSATREDGMRYFESSLSYFCYIAQNSRRVGFVPRELVRLARGLSWLSELTRVSYFVTYFS